MLHKSWMILLATLALSTPALADEPPAAPAPASAPAKKKGHWVAQSVTTIDATPAQVMTLVADLQQWKDWTAWSADRDPQATWQYTGSPGTVGHQMTWDGPELGQGRLVLTRVEANHLEYDFFFGKSKKANFGSITLSGAAEGPTTVTWYDDGKARLFKKKIGEMVTQDLVVGLGKLKPRGEALALHARHVAKIAAVEAELATLKAQSEAAAKAATDARAAAEAAAKAASEANAAAAKLKGKKATEASKAAAGLSISAATSQGEADKAAALAGEKAAAVAGKAAELEALKASGG